MRRVTSFLHVGPAAPRHLTYCIVQCWPLMFALDIDSVEGSGDARYLRDVVADLFSDVVAVRMLVRL